MLVSVEDFKTVSSAANAVAKLLFKFNFGAAPFSFWVGLPSLPLVPDCPCPFLVLTCSLQSEGYGDTTLIYDSFHWNKSTTRKSCHWPASQKMNLLQAAQISIYFSERTLLASSFTAATKAINFVSSFSISLESVPDLVEVFFHFPASNKCLYLVSANLQSSSAVKASPSSHSDFLSSILWTKVSCSFSVSRPLKVQ